MGSSRSKEKNDKIDSSDDVPERKEVTYGDQEMAMSEVNKQQLDIYQNYVTTVSRYKFAVNDFQFAYCNNSGLTLPEFNLLLDEYKIPRSHGLGDQGCRVVTLTSDDGFVKKSILIFIRRTDGKVDVTIAEATQSQYISKKRVATAYLGSALISGLVGLSVFATGGAALVPLAIAFSVTASATTAKLVYDIQKTTFKDVVIGYMMSELIKRNQMRIVGESVFYVRNGHQYRITNDGLKIEEAEVQIVEDN